MKYKRREILFVDGYNMIGAWPELAQLQKKDEIAEARDQLLFALSDYRKYRDITIIVVFDAQFVPGITKTYNRYHLSVVFTQEGETADSYIEREVSQWISPVNRVVVATSDMAEQWLIFQRGALRMSAMELLLEINYSKKQIRQEVKDYYSARLRRRSPWEVEQMRLLDELRDQLNKNE
ncbi:NYN domain-containing protein [Facklamia sp. DSM 111018]|uniref:NYN domain-containing protein n=1 Tax=Facklamia lactis TaxID=2749967 RepID=A0ABS0LT48_9LACT|nr:NYN domain-containing protein [Facklamia lactis]MBG9981335.1 NYN domain-containing protein [Facklamia lactis]MBG9987189.1 NYN domain-containing protein [Facklamia lactis]